MCDYSLVPSSKEVRLSGHVKAVRVRVFFPYPSLSKFNKHPMCAFFILRFHERELWELVFLVSPLCFLKVVRHLQRYN